MIHLVLEKLFNRYDALGESIEALIEADREKHELAISILDLELGYVREKIDCVVDSEWRIADHTWTAKRIYNDIADCKKKLDDYMKTLNFLANVGGEHAAARELIMVKRASMKDELKYMMDRVYRCDEFDGRLQSIFDPNFQPADDGKAPVGYKINNFEGPGEVPPV